MGQKPSSTSNKPTTLPLIWILKSTTKTHNPNPEQPIKFQYKTRRKGSIDQPPDREEKQTNLKKINNLTVNQSDVVVKNNNLNEVTCKVLNTVASVPRTKSEPNIYCERKHRPRIKKTTRTKCEKVENAPTFGYDIEDVDEFLTKASIEKPANIPVVLAFASVLYQTRVGGYQAEISLPLGMVVNAVFKNQNWLYVQTPHAEEGYISYAACMPLGIIPTSYSSSSPCWDNSTDVFPQPCGNMTDTEKISSRSECSASRCRSRSRRSRNAASTCGERSVDRLYLRAAASNKNKGIRQTLLVVASSYEKESNNTLSVTKGDVVTLLSTHIRGWFWVKRKDGCEGFIPAAIAGHGFL